MHYASWTNAAEESMTLSMSLLMGGSQPALDGLHKQISLDGEQMDDYMRRS